ncbi:hypothetical protein ACFU6I_06150 [Streptomyces sp. NPDC057486]|uniref:hypothetical protein n=1 Tax=Streptomyces sp. NPDC057486 TaxID=3346145 RepID=UPI00368DA521
MSYVKPLHTRVRECGARGAVLDRDIDAVVHVAMVPGGGAGPAVGYRGNQGVRSCVVKRGGE